MTRSRSVRRCSSSSSLAVPLLVAVAVAASAVPCRTLADYTCRVSDVPGSTVTQAWQVNSAGQVAVLSDFGGSVYFSPGGAWLALPPPLADSGYSAVGLAALGINDSLAIAGSAVRSEGAVTEEGFILAKGNYSFFAVPGFNRTVARAIGNNAVAVGLAYNDSTFMVGFIHNPASVPDYPTGTTQVVPVLNGTAAQQTIANGMNGLGQIVGSARFPGVPRYGFLYDPRWASRGYEQLITFFRVDDLNTAARGINDWGRIVGFTTDASGTMTGFLMTGLGHRPIRCPQLGDGISVAAQSINNRGVVAGNWNDASGNLHGFVAYPDSADDLADLLEAVMGVGSGRRLETTVHEAQASFAKGKVQETCEALDDFKSELKRQSGKKVARELAATLRNEAEAISAQVGCS